ncbi:MAG: hypothetical protein AAF585_08110 [Verrucomicrobiota bacterium]
MKNPILKVSFVVLVILAHASLRVMAQEPPEFAKIKSGYDTRKAAIEKKFVDGVSELATKYTGALDRLVEEYSKNGRLDDALLARGEIESLKNANVADAEGEIPELRNPPVELSRLRDFYDQGREKLSADQVEQTKALNSVYIKSLDQLVEKFTRSQNLDGAVLVRNEKKAVEAETLAFQRESAADDLASTIEFEKAMDEDIKEEIRKSFQPALDKYRGESGSVGYAFSEGLAHTVERFPDSRLCFPNRSFSIPELAIEPKKGTILAPEFRTDISDLRVSIDGSVVVLLYQGMRVNRVEETEEVMKALRRRGWTKLHQNWDDTTKLPADTEFGMIKVVTDEVLTFEPQGGWKQLPTLVFGPMEQGQIAVSEVK